MPPTATVTESHEQRSATLTTEAKGAVRVFDVVVDSNIDPLLAPGVAIDAPGVPVLYASHPSSRWMYVASKTATPKGGPFTFEVTVNYDYPKNNTQYESDPGDPLLVPMEVEFTHVTGNEQIDHAINGYPITNSAGESFDPPPTRDVSDLVLRITRNESAFDSQRAMQYKDAVNSDWFGEFAPGRARCTGFSGRQMHAADITYWQVSYEFQIRSDGWELRHLDEGFRENINGVLENFKDKDGSQVAQPVPLNGFGEKLADGATAVFREFVIYPSLPFQVLGL